VVYGLYLYFLLWVAVEAVQRFIFGVYLSRYRNMLVAEAFLKTLVEKYVSIRFIAMEHHGTLKPAES
jgi:transposase-like protein